MKKIILFLTLLQNVQANELAFDPREELVKVDQLIQEDQWRKNLEQEKEKIHSIQNFKSPDFPFIPLEEKTASLRKSFEKIDDIENIAPEKIDLDLPDGSIFIFISTSMPQKELKLLSYEAKKFHGTLVLRGFYQDFKKTIKFLQEVFGKELKDINLMIDPRLFKIFGIESVPSFVKILSINTEKKAIIASGSVSLEYFLEKTK